jgi:hypothetical protein
VYPNKIAGALLLLNQFAEMQQIDDICRTNCLRMMPL